VKLGQESAHKRCLCFLFHLERSCLKRNINAEILLRVCVCVCVSELVLVMCV